MPAQFTRKETGPNSLEIRAAAVSTAKAEDASQVRDRKLGAERDLATTRSRIATRAPRAANSAAVASPMPEAPPVITATLSAQGFALLLFVSVMFVSVYRACPLVFPLAAGRIEFPGRWRTNQAVEGRDRKRSRPPRERGPRSPAFCRDQAPRPDRDRKGQRFCRLHTSSCRP